jgi:hypothetical protein
MTTYNVGRTAGADEETVIIGRTTTAVVVCGRGRSASPRAGAGGVLVAARERRAPQSSAELGAHGAGRRAFVEEHREELAQTVLEVHLEHAANEFAEVDGRLQPTGLPEARWWFTSSISQLQATVQAAIEAEDLGRSLLMPPTAFGPRPTTDGTKFYVAGVPIVKPHGAVYLFDSCDTMDKIHRRAWCR